MERHELPIRLRDRGDLRLELDIQAVERCGVRRGVGIVRRLAGRIELGQLRRDLWDVVLAHEAGVEPEVRVLLAVLRQRRDPGAENELRRLAACARGEEPVKKVIEADAVRDDQPRVSELAGVVWLRFVILGADAGRDDRRRCDAGAAHVLDDVGEDGRGRHDLQGVRVRAGNAARTGGWPVRRGLAAERENRECRDHQHPINTATQSHQLNAPSRPGVIRNGFAGSVAG